MSTGAQRLKVAFVFISMPVGGAEDFALTVARHLPAEVAPVFVCLRSLGAIGEELRASGGDIHLLPIAPGKRWNVAGVWKFGRWLREHGVAVVHSQTYNAHTYAIPAARVAGCASILHQQKTLEPLRPHRRWIMRGLCALATKVVVLSERTRLDLARAFRVPESRTLTVPNVVDRSAFRPAADRRAVRRSLGLDEDRFLLGAVASLHEVKNHEATLRMLAALRANGVDFRALLIGEGKSRARLEGLAAELKLGAQLTLVGARRPVLPWLQALDLLVLPSLWEGQPMILLQAMACGVPIVASRIEGNIAALGDAHPGLFTLEGPEAYRRVVQRVAGDAAFRDAILAQQRAVSAAQPDAPEIAARLADLYRDLAGRRPA